MNSFPIDGFLRPADQSKNARFGIGDEDEVGSIFVPNHPYLRSYQHTGHIENIGGLVDKPGLRRFKGR
jgi:hypothetical protein